METLRKKLAGAALAGMLMTGAFAAPAAAHDEKSGQGGHSYGHKKDRDERKDWKVDVIVKYKKHGKWYSEEKEDVKLEKAASIADYKCDGSKWHQHFRDAKYTDRSGKNVKTCEQRYVKVYFEQNEDDHHHDDKDDHHHDDKKDKKY